MHREANDIDGTMKAPTLGSLMLSAEEALGGSQDLGV